MFTIASLYINALNKIIGDKEGGKSTPFLFSLPLNDLFQWVFCDQAFQTLGQKSFSIILPTLCFKKYKTEFC